MTATNIDDHRPHVMLPTLDGNVHVLPASVIERIISGDIAIEEVDDWREITRSIIAEWWSGNGAIHAKGA